MPVYTSPTMRCSFLRNPSERAGGHIKAVNGDSALDRVCSLGDVHIVLQTACNEIPAVRTLLLVADALLPPHRPVHCGAQGQLPQPARRIRGPARHHKTCSCRVRKASPHRPVRMRDRHGLHCPPTRPPPRSSSGKTKTKCASPSLKGALRWTPAQPAKSRHREPSWSARYPPSSSLPNGMGGKRKNMPKSKREEFTRRRWCERPTTNHDEQSSPLTRTASADHTALDATVYMMRWYETLPNPHKAQPQRSGDVRGTCIPTAWRASGDGALIRGMSEKHRPVLREFAGKHSVQTWTPSTMGAIVLGGRQAPEVHTTHRRQRPSGARA